MTRADYPYYSEGLLNPAYTALWADQYALTMAQAFFTNGRHDTRAVFHAYVRDLPFGGSYLVTGGQNIFFEWLEKHWRFDAADIAQLRRETTLDDAGDAVPLYTDAFLDFIADAKPELTIDAMPEGEIAFADEPIYRVQGPLWQCLMVEAALLNTLNSQSLFATLASHLVELADGAPVLEFGLRRTQSLAGLEAARGAYIGGITGTSNVLARKFYGIPSVGTMAHALVMAYEDEIRAFADYARAMPHSGVFLVDTYNTLEGVRHAIAACRDAGVRLRGIRLDSGDLAFLASAARGILDAAGLKDAVIIASDSLTYKRITEMKAKQVPVDVWAIGGYLVNSPDQPAVGPVYKPGAIAGPDGRMRDVIKLSEVAGKISIPGALDVVRYLHRQADGRMRFDGDTIVKLEDEPIVNEEGMLARAIVSVEKIDDTNTRDFSAGTLSYRPLVRCFENGRRVAAAETVHDARARAAAQLAMLEDSHRGMPGRYPYRVGIEQALYRQRRDMIKALRRSIKKS